LEPEAASDSACVSISRYIRKFEFYLDSENN
jgi:hypothetical protein